VVVLIFIVIFALTVVAFIVMEFFVGSCYCCSGFITCVVSGVVVLMFYGYYYSCGVGVNCLVFVVITEIPCYPFSS
jgi:hypothetical protein